MEMPAAVEAPLRKRALLAERRLPAWLVREAPLVALFAFYWVALLRSMPYEIAQDGWYALLTGREIVDHGLPDRDYMTVFGMGRDWIDQPWLAQLGFYGLYVLGDLNLALLAHTVFVAAAFGLAMLAARRLGASPRSVLVVALPSAVAAPWAWQFRTQSAAYLFFVAVLWLLAADSRSPSRRVFWVLPLLVVWSNVHGSVALGVGLAGLHGLLYGAGQLRRSDRARRWVARTLVLTAGPALCLLANPYGIELARYYLKRPSSSALGQVNLEWAPTTPSLTTAVFYGLAFTSVWLLGRAGRRLTVFEKAAVVVMLTVAVYAGRGVVWFPLVAIVLLPAAVDGIAVLAGARPAPAAVRIHVAAAGLAVMLAASFLIASAVRPSSWYESHWSAAGVDAVGEAAAGDPEARVFASSRYADWLLWKRPELVGRLAFDTRLGMYSDDQLRALYRYRNRIGDWKPLLDGFAIVVLETDGEAGAIAELDRERGTRIVFADDDVTILVRDAPRSAR
jgi:hypothetical protein